MRMAGLLFLSAEQEPNAGSEIEELNMMEEKAEALEDTADGMYLPFGSNTARSPSRKWRVFCSRRQRGFG